MGAPESADEPAARAELTVVNAHGLHARPSHAVVRTAGAFDAEVRLHFDGRVADGRSMLAVLMLGAGQGARLRVEARGRQAAAAVTALAALFARGFEEA